MAQISRDVLWSSLFGQYVPVPQHEKTNGTMVPTGENNPLPVKGEVTLSGSSLDLRGLAASKPAANAVQIGTTYWSVDTDPLAMKAEVSDGTKWTVMG